MRRELFEVTSFTLVGSLLLRGALTVTPSLAGWSPAIWLYLPLCPLLLRRRSLAPYGYAIRSWRLTWTRRLLVGPGLLSAFALGIGVWRLLVGTHPLVDGTFLSFDMMMRQLLWVALPEELFFRGYVLQRLLDAAPPHQPQRFCGSILLSAALFALAHVVTLSGWRRAAVFFPGCLMAWLRVHSQGLLLPTLFHWLANLLALGFPL